MKTRVRVDGGVAGTPGLEHNHALLDETDDGHSVGRLAGGIVERRPATRGLG